MVSGVVRSAWEEEIFLFLKPDFLAGEAAEILKDGVDVMEITLDCFPKENVVVGKEEMEEAGTITIELNRLPKIKSTSILNGKR